MVRHSTLWLLPMALWLASASAGARAEGIAVGSFCIEGVQARDLPNETVQVDNGTWRYRRYRHGTDGRGQVVVFARFVAKDPNELPSCAAVKARALAQGIPVLLEGSIRHLDLKVGHLSSGDRNSYVIAPNGLSLTIGRVSSGFSRIGGGRLNLSGSRAWIKNPTRININPDGMAGLFRIASWNRRLEGAVLRLSGGATATADFVGPRLGNTIFDLDTSSGIARLHDATFTGFDLAFDGGNLVGEVAQFQNVALTLARAVVNVRSGRVDVRATDARGRAASVSVGQDPSVTFDQADVAWARAEAGADQATDAFAVAPLRFAGLSLSGSATLKTGGQSLVTGPAQAAYENLGLQRMVADLRFAAPATPALDFILPAGSVSAFDLRMTGTPAALDLAGTFAANRMTIGSLRFAAPSKLTFSRKAGQPELRLPVNLALRNIAGDFEIAEPNQTILLTATLRRLQLAGAIVIDLGDLAATRLEVPAGKLHLHLDAAAAAKPILAGIKPTLAQTGIIGGNSTDLVVRRPGATGLVEFNTPLLVLGQPVVKIGSAGTSARVGIDIKAEGGATLRHDLATSKMSLAAADLRIRDVDMAPLDRGFVVDAGGFLVGDPRLKIQALDLTLVRDAPEGVARGAGLSLAGTSVRKLGAKPTDFSLEGRIAQPFAIGSLEGRVGVGPDEIELRELDLGQVGFGVAGAELTLGEGMSLSDASVALRAGQVRSVSGRQAEAAGTAGLFFTNLDVAADGKLRASGNFTLDISPTLSNLRLILSGRSDRLTGRGSAMLSGFLGRLTNDLDTSFRCSDGASLKIPMTARMASGPSSLTLAANEGEFTADGAFNAFGLNLSFVGERRCSSPSKKHVIQEEKMGSMTGWCPTWREPTRTCTWKTVIVPEISFTYEIELKVLALSATAFLAQPRIRFAKKTQFLCNVGPMALVAPLFVGGYYPQLSDPTVLNDIVNVVIELVAIPVESAIATGLLNLASATLTLVASDQTLMPVGSTVCVAKGRW